MLTLGLTDGLQFRVLQENDGSRHLKVFWQDVDAMHMLSTIKELIRDHELYQIFELRAITVVLDIVRGQLGELTGSRGEGWGSGTAEVRRAVSHLISLETAILERTIQVLDDQVSLSSVDALLSGVEYGLLHFTV